LHLLIFRRIYMAGQITTTVQNQVASLYVSLLGRNPDSTGFGFWTNSLANAGDTLQAQNAIAIGFSASPEFISVYGGQTTAQAVNLMYTNILGRAPDANGAAYWTSVANNLIENGTPVGQAYALTGYQLIWTAANNGSSDSAAVNTKIAAAVTQGSIPGVTTTLTTNGTGATFTAGVQVPAGQLVLNDLIVNASQTVSLPAGATILASSLTVNSTETSNVNTTAAGWSAITTEIVNSASVGRVPAVSTPEVITAQATTNVTVNDAAYDFGTTNATGAGVTVAGGNNVLVNETGATATASAIKVGGSSTTNPTGAVNVVVTGKGNTTVTVDGGSSETVTTNATGAVSLGTNTTATGAATVTDTGGTGTITIGSGSSATVTTTATAANAVTISGVTGADTVTESAVTGGLITIDGGTGVTVNTTGNIAGAVATIGSNAVVTGAISVTDTNSLAASADVINIDTLAGSAPVGAVTVTTGATSGAITVGVNTAGKGVVGNVTIANQTTYSNGKTVYGAGNAESVYVNGATAVTLSGGTIDAVVDEATVQTLTALSLTGVTGASTAVGTALTTFTINNAISGSGLTVTNGKAGHTDTVNISGDTGSSTYVGPVFNDAVASTINVIATGAANSISVTDALAGKVNLSFTNNGTGTLTLGTLAEAGFTGSTSTFTLGGTGAINVGTAFSTAYNGNNYATLTQTGTGAVTATVNVGQNFAGGTSTGDVITVLGATPAITGSIVGGSGGNNTVNFVGAPYTVAQSGAFSGFQNLELSTGGANGTWIAAPYSSLLVSGLTQTQVSAGVGNSVTFTNLTGTQPLSVLAQAATSSATFTETFGAAGDTFSITINGASHTFTAGANPAADTAAINLYYGTTAPINGVTVTDTTGAIVITGAGSASFANLTGNTALAATNTLSGVVTETLATAAAAATGNTLTLNVGKATDTGTTTAVIAEANNQTIAINSVLGSAAAATVANTVTITDSTATAAANQATTLNLSGAGNVTVIYSDIGISTNALTTINASSATGAVNVSAVQGATSGLTITGGSGALTASGSGTVTGETATSYRTANDVITTGSGGGTITVGYAGSGGATGSTRINLAASAAKKSTITDSSDAVNGGRATIAGYISSASSTTADFLGINGITNQTALATQATPQNIAQGTYTVSNGVITFAGVTDTGAALLADAQAIVNAAAANTVAAYTDGTNTYVVSSGSGQTAARDTVYTLSGVTNITEVGGYTAATGNVLLSGTTTVSAATAAVNTAAVTQNDAGYSVQAISGAGTSAQTFTNLAASALINDTSSSAGYALTVSQAGVAGSNSLTITSATNPHTYSALNVTTDAVLTLNGSQAVTVTSLVDSGNTLATLNLTGSGALTIGAITDTALTKISDTDLAAAVIIGGTATPITQAALNVTLGAQSGFAPVTGTAIYTSGAGDTIDAHFTASAVTAANIVLSATGAGSTVLGGAAAAGADGETIVVGATGTVTMLQGVAAAVGVSAVTGDTGLNLITVGANSVVTLGTTSAGVASDGGSTITVTGDTAGTALSNFVTINNVNNGATNLVMFAAGTDINGKLVNVASASTFAAAENLAVKVATSGGTAGNNYYAAFHWTDGNTYVIGHTGAAETALSATDVVVKLVGIDSPALTHANGVILL
jgi:hypothetical protein